MLLAAVTADSARDVASAALVFERVADRGGILVVLQALHSANDAVQTLQNYLLIAVHCAQYASGLRATLFEHSAVAIILPYATGTRTCSSYSSASHQCSTRAYDNENKVAARMNKRATLQQRGRGTEKNVDARENLYWSEREGEGRRKT